jgi:hypothetical protein
MEDIKTLLEELKEKSGHLGVNVAGDFHGRRLARSPRQVGQTFD